MEKTTQNMGGPTGKKLSVCERTIPMTRNPFIRSSTGLRDFFSSECVVTIEFFAMVTFLFSIISLPRPEPHRHLVATIPGLRLSWVSCYRFFSCILFITFNRVNSSRSFSSSALVMSCTRSVYMGIVMFCRALARFCVFLMLFASR